jgi:hypothetical protein
MNRSRRTERLGGLAVSAVVAGAFAGLGVAAVNAGPPPTANEQIEAVSGYALIGTPWTIAAWLLWRAWWRRAGARLSGMDGPARLLAAASARLPQDRRDWGAAMAAELAQVQGRSARWRFAAGCARTAFFPPPGSRTAVGWRS